MNYKAVTIPEDIRIILDLSEKQAKILSFIGCIAENIGSKEWGELVDNYQRGIEQTDLGDYRTVARMLESIRFNIKEIK